MDKLLLAATYYKIFLINRDFHLLAGDSKKNQLEFDVIFREEHFRHLIGFDKLIDISEARNKKYNLFENALNGNITYEYISKSAYIDEIMPRLDYFLQIRETLFSKRLFIGKTDEHTFHRISADYLFIKDVDGGITNLFLKLIKSKLAVPVSYFKTDSLKYCGKSWTVLNRYETTNNSYKVYSSNELIDIRRNIVKSAVGTDILINAYFIFNNEIYKIVECNLVERALELKICDIYNKKFEIHDFVNESGKFVIRLS